MKLRLEILITCFIGSLPFVAMAHPDIESSHNWKKTAQQDLNAARNLLANDHPGALNEVGDKNFLHALNDGYQDAQKNISQVTNYHGYRAILNQFARQFNDNHISSYPIDKPELISWPGFIVNLKKEKWRINEIAEQWSTELPSEGSELISCDGKAVEVWAKETYGKYIANLDVEAQKERYSSWLFIGENGLPAFDKQPSSCQFKKNNKVFDLTVNFQKQDRKTIRTKVLTQPVRSKAGFGISKIGEGYWISFEALYGDIDKIVEEVEAKKQQISKSEFVVLDVRGNMGGDTNWANRIAIAVYGEQYVAPAIGAPYVNLPNKESYRISEANVEMLEKQLADNIEYYGDDQVAIDYQKKIFEEIKMALKHHKNLAPVVSIDNRKVTYLLPDQKVEKEFKGKLLLLTDNACFSSCLLMTDFMLRLGAIQIGRSTNFFQRYYDMKNITLPSGLSGFTTMTKVDFGSTQNIGPFKPKYEYSGNLNDTEKLKKWVLTNVKGFEL